jgi:copper resistance protein B|tara:strand:+ start:581 stop:1324 length:744 start_codon:yes stop_codon:yes gene_type:complete
MVARIINSNITWSQTVGLFLLAGATLFSSPLKAAEGEPLYSQVLVDRLEYQTNEGNEVITWDAQGWYGGDAERLWVKTEGTYLLETGNTEEAELQLLYSRAIARFWDLQAGIRQDFRPRPTRTYGVFGVQGLAPQWFEVDVAAFVSDEGDVSARALAEYDLFVTQRLILQPLGELNFALQDVPELGVGSGLNSVELGLRLRYEIEREFAPYVGVSWTRLMGDTEDFARAEGENVEPLSLVAGIRVWF